MSGYQHPLFLLTNHPASFTLRRMTTRFSLIQQQVIESPLNIRLFVSVRAGTGKTTVGVERMRATRSRKSTTLTQVW